MVRFLPITKGIPSVEILLNFDLAASVIHTLSQKVFQEMKILSPILAFSLLMPKIIAIMIVTACGCYLMAKIFKDCFFVHQKTQTYDLINAGYSYFE